MNSTPDILAHTGELLKLFRTTGRLQCLQAYDESLQLVAKEFKQRNLDYLSRGHDGNVLDRAYLLQMTQLYDAFKLADESVIPQVAKAEKLGRFSNGLFITITNVPADVMRSDDRYPGYRKTCHYGEYPYCVGFEWYWKRCEEAPQPKK